MSFIKECKYNFLFLKISRVLRNLKQICVKKMKNMKVMLKMVSNRIEQQCLSGAGMNKLLV